MKPKDVDKHMRTGCCYERNEIVDFNRRNFLKGISLKNQGALLG